MAQEIKTSENLKLTQTVQKGGCAAKVAASELRKILTQVSFPPISKNVLIDGGTFDDAAVYKINSELALVQTLDFFTPIVDSPKLFGQIAAANALSDVYAMGGLPKTAMAILAFPLATMDQSVAIDVLQGASDCITESKAVFVGGHTIDDDTLKFGLSVTGFVHPEKIWSNAKAQVDDILILTKPLGTGTLTAALKRGHVNESEIYEALESMCLLNDVVSLLSDDMQSSIHAATDVTGFGLAGHAYNMAKASQVGLHMNLEELPYFSHALDFLQQGFLTKAHRTNKDYVNDFIFFAKESSQFHQLVFDPQTSGGLILAVKAEFADIILKQISKKFINAKIIGHVKALQNKKYLNFN